MIFIRECGHSDVSTRRTKHPNRCYYCWYAARMALEGPKVALQQPKALKAYQDVKRIKQGPKIEDKGTL